MLVGGFNQSSLNVALPEIAHDLSATADQATWILLGYMLASTGLIVIFGRLSDMLSRRRMFALGMLLFTLASLAVGFGTSAWVVIVLRALSGVGAAMMWSTSGALLTSSLPRMMLGQGMGVYYAASSVAQLIGPVVGGVITDTLGWRWLFWVNVPVAAVATCFAFTMLRKEERSPRTGRFDIGGAVTGFAVLGSVVTTLSAVSGHGWTNPTVLIGLLLIVLILPVFIFRERRASAPLLDLGLFRERLFAWASLASFMNQFVRFGLLLFIALIYQTLYGFSPTQAGLLVLPIAIGTLLSSPWAGALERRVRSAVISSVGAGLSLVGVALCSTMIWLPHWYLVVALGGFVSGFGGGMVITANTSAIMRQAPSDSLGSVSSVRVMIQSLGVAFGTAGVLTGVAAFLPPAGKAAVYAGQNGVLSATAREGLSYGVPLTLGLLAIASVATIYASRLAYRGFTDDLHLGAEAKVAITASS